MMSQVYLQLEILWPAMVIGLLVLITHVPLGREVLNRGIIFLDLAIAQTAAFGVVLSNTVFLAGDEHTHLDPTFVAVVAAIIGSVALYWLRNFEVRIQEACIGILFVLMATGIVLLLSADPHGAERLKEILVGQILWLQPRDLFEFFLASTAAFFIWFYCKDKLGEWLFYPLFAVVVTLSTQMVGVYLVFASLIIPSVCTLKRSNPLLKAYAIGAVGYCAGLLCSAFFDLPAGATVVWVLTAVACAYALMAKLLLKVKKHSP